MKVIDKYLGKEFLFWLLLSLITTTTFFFIIQILDRINFLMIKLKLPLKMMLFYLSYELPRIAFLALPLSCFFGLMILFGLLARRNEIVIFQGAGIPGARLLVSPFIITVIFAWVGYLVGANIVPIANYKASQFRKRYIEAKPSELKKIPDLWLINKKEKTMVFHFKIFDLAQNKAEGFTIYELGDNFQPIREIYAERAKIIAEEKWHLYNLKEWDYKIPQSSTLKEIDELIIKIPLETKSLALFHKTPSDMTYTELKEYIEKIETYGLDSKECLVEFYSRSALGFSPIILFLLGAGLIIRLKKSAGLLENLGFGLLFSFIYFFLMAEGLASGRSGFITPFISAWLANFIFLIIIGMLILRVERS